MIHHILTSSRIADLVTIYSWDEIFARLLLNSSPKIRLNSYNCSPAIKEGRGKGMHTLTTERARRWEHQPIYTLRVNLWQPRWLHRDILVTSRWHCQITFKIHVVLFWSPSGKHGNPRANLKNSVCEVERGLCERIHWRRGNNTHAASQIVVFQTSLTSRVPIQDKLFTLFVSVQPLATAVGQAHFSTQLGSIV